MNTPDTILTALDPDLDISAQEKEGNINLVLEQLPTFRTNGKDICLEVVSPLIGYAATGISALPERGKATFFNNIISHLTSAEAEAFQEERWLEGKIREHLSNRGNVKNLCRILQKKIAGKDRMGGRFQGLDTSGIPASALPPKIQSGFSSGHKRKSEFQAALPDVSITEQYDALMANIAEMGPRDPRKRKAEHNLLYLASRLPPAEINSERFNQIVQILRSISDFPHRTEMISLLAIRLGGRETSIEKKGSYCDAVNELVNGISPGPHYHYAKRYLCAAVLQLPETELTGKRFDDCALAFSALPSELQMNAGIVKFAERLADTPSIASGSRCDVVNGLVESIPHEDSHYHRAKRYLCAAVLQLPETELTGKRFDDCARALPVLPPDLQSNAEIANFAARLALTPSLIDGSRCDRMKDIVATMPTTDSFRTVADSFLASTIVQLQQGELTGKRFDYGMEALQALPSHHPKRSAGIAAFAKRLAETLSLIDGSRCDRMKDIVAIMPTTDSFHTTANCYLAVTVTRLQQEELAEKRFDYGMDALQALPSNHSQRSAGIAGFAKRLAVTPLLVTPSRLERMQNIVATIPTTDSLHTVAQNWLNSAKTQSATERQRWNRSGSQDRSGSWRAQGR